MGNRTAVLVLVVTLLTVMAIAVPGAAGADDGTVDRSATADERTSYTVLTAESASDQSVLADSHVEECADEPPDDFADPDGGTSETIGWVDGYWYNEPLDIDGELENPLTEDELEELLPRTAARVEALRCLAFEDVPPVNATTVEERVDEAEERLLDVDDEYRDFSNAQMKTKLLVDTDTDAVDVEAKQQGATATAYYNIEEEYMGFVVNEPGLFEINQDTLAHELLHALQDQHFDITEPFERTTNDGHVAALAVVEGDATVLDEMYAENCETGWEDDCLTFQPDLPEPPNWGSWVNIFAAYSTPLVAETYEAEGWDGVNELLESYPESTVEAIYPDQYGEFEKVELTVEDESEAHWEQVAVEGQTTDVVGQQGLLGMLIAPTLETEGLVEIASVQEFIQTHDGGPYNYDHSAVNGWQGDNFIAYTSEEGDRGAVWKIAWEDDTEAETFANAYEELLEFRGAEPVPEYANVYSFDSEEEWDMTVAVEHSDDRFWIVSAPTVEELTAVHDIELVEADDPTPADEGDETPAETGADGDDSGAGTDDGTGGADGDDDGATADVDDDGAGFGIVAGVVAALLGTLVVQYRQHR